MGNGMLQQIMIFLDKEVYIRSFAVFAAPKFELGPGCRVIVSPSHERTFRR
jgi:hypothetical protein